MVAGQGKVTGPGPLASYFISTLVFLAGQYAPLLHPCVQKSCTLLSTSVTAHTTPSVFVAKIFLISLL